MSGTIVAAGQGSSTAEKFIFKGEVSIPGSERSQSIVAGSDGNRYYLIDENSKTVHADFDAQVQVLLEGRSSYDDATDYLTTLFTKLLTP